MKNFHKKVAAVSVGLVVISAAIIFFSAIYMNNVMESLLYHSSLKYCNSEAFIYASCLISASANLLIYIRKTKLAPIIMSAAAVVSAYIFRVDVIHSEITVFDSPWAQKNYDWRYGFAVETANTVFFLICAAAVITVCGAVYAYSNEKQNAEIKGNGFME